MPRNKFMPSGIDGDEELEKIKGLLQQKVASALVEIDLLPKNHLYF